jgi:hypothetical protein
MKAICIVLVFGVIVGLDPVEAQNIQGGRTIQVKLEQEVTTRSASPGDSVSVRLTRSLTNGGGVIAPAGSRWTGRVDFVQEKSMNEDGWMRLLFNRVSLPDGHELRAVAVASFYTPQPHPKRDHLLWITGLATIGLVLGGHNERVTAGLGGAIVGLVLAENKNLGAHDLTLRAGQKILLRLNEDDFKDRQDRQ